MEMAEQKQLTDLLQRLQRSKFRSSFHLKEKERQYILQKGWPVIQRHAEDFIKNRLAPAVIANDGRQTPMKGHPVFIAQHATATCCRKCLYRWYQIPAGRVLTPKEQAFLVAVLMAWLQKEMQGYAMNQSLE